MKKDVVLLVEDARDMHLIVQSALVDQCELICASTISEAESVLKKQTISLIILDVNLPDGDGFSFCEHLRSSALAQELPIIFLTGESSVDRRVVGFSAGADDYVTKPLEPNEFAARVAAKLKRHRQAQKDLEAANIRIELATQKAYLNDGTIESVMNLTPIEFKLLAHFMKKKGSVLSREELMTTVWGNNVHIAAHTVDTHISSLRKKLGENGRYLKAVVKQGYRFSPVEKTGEQAS